jgi:hypothetical protein
MKEWLKPVAILGTLFILLAANILEFRAKRRSDLALIASLEQEAPRERLAAKQYRQTQNIEQLLHIIVTLLFAILVSLLWT